ncbi:Uncharacterised protein [Legionella busanensis]|uniref:Transmembrane protein n=1 Tax=Legionella busanensis TaxID=190655 RepID=A0A378JLK6_9GAMM|nr:hypothetical protein [Legionella busanensis]STX51957.1 Uncharacterised protein [Legionella busanensis]
MDNNKNKNPLSPSWVGAIFFAVFAFCFLLFTKYILLSLQQSAVLPFFPALLVALITGIFLGAIFTKYLTYPKSWIYAFLIGILMALIATALIGLVIFLNLYFSDSTFTHRLHHWQDFFILYGTIFLSLFLIIGLWLMLFTGLAAVYFSKHFWPTLIAIDKAHSKTNHS